MAWQKCLHTYRFPSLCWDTRVNRVVSAQLGGGHPGDNTLGEGALAHLRPRLLWEPSKTERVLLAEGRDTQISGT